VLGFPTKTLYTSLTSLHATCPAHLILLDLITDSLMLNSLTSSRVQLASGAQTLCVPFSINWCSLNMAVHAVVVLCSWANAAVDSQITNAD